MMSKQCPRKIETRLFLHMHSFLWFTGYLKVVQSHFVQYLMNNIYHLPDIEAILKIITESKRIVHTQIMQRLSSQFEQSGPFISQFSLIDQGNERAWKCERVRHNHRYLYLAGSAINGCDSLVLLAIWDGEASPAVAAPKIWEELFKKYIFRMIDENFNNQVHRMITLRFRWSFLPANLTELVPLRSKRESLRFVCLWILHILILTESTKQR